MTPRKSIVSIDNETTDEEILKIIEEEGYSRMPVMDDENENIIGIFYVRDYLLKRTNKNFKRKSVIQQPVFVPESIHLDVLFKDMQKERFHMAVVVNEYGEVSGIVTMEDILEELVGEIWDELDEEVQQFTMVDENNYIVMTNVLVEEFKEYFDLENEIETDATTINGLITEIADSIPEIGYTFELQNLSITVTKANDFMTVEIAVWVNPKEVEETEE